MSILQSRLPNEDRWQKLVEKKAERLDLRVRTKVEQHPVNPFNLSQETHFTFTIFDAHDHSIEEDFLPLKHRIRGFLVELAEVMSDLACRLNVDAYISSASGEKRMAQNKAVRMATREEMERGSQMFIVERIPLSGKTMREELEALPADVDPRVTVAFQQLL